MLNKFIFSEIEKSILLGYSSVTIDLKNSIFSQVKSNDFDFIRNKLEAEGYDVNYILGRSPNGKREMLIRW